MSRRGLFTIVVTLLLTIFFICVYLFRSTLLPQNVIKTLDESVEQSEKSSALNEELSVDRIKMIEDAIEELEEKNKDQDDSIETVSKKSIQTATPTGTSKQKGIVETASNQGGVFTTTSTVYSSMSLYVNIRCPTKCILWTNFYTSSKNTDTSDAVNTYGVFLNGGDTSVHNKATIPIANNTIPIALNAALPVGAGTHTVEIKAKTSGGKLQSDISYLQVMAIEE